MPRNASSVISSSFARAFGSRAGVVEVQERDADVDVFGDAGHGADGRIET